MTENYNFVPRLRRLVLVGLLAGGASAAQAQALPYAAANVLKFVGTYTDLGSNGTVIATPNTDDANSAAQTIPFTFRFNGTNFTQFVLNTNGYLKMGSVAPVAPFFNDSGQAITGGPVNGPDQNLILPFNGDLTAGTAGGTEYRMALSGSTPNQVLTIQWKNVQDKLRAATPTDAATPVQYANFSFQVKLYEAGSQIDFVYDRPTPAPLFNDFAKFINVGLKGSGTMANQLILGSKSSSTPWASTPFIAGPYTQLAHNVRVAVLPERGRTYSFTLPVANDAAVQVIYGYDQLALPAGQPLTLRAVVRNAGTTALPAATATLAVSGANMAAATQPVPALAVGASATLVFAGINLLQSGNNTVTVALGNDGNNANNIMSMLMVTNATTTSFITAGVPPSSAFSVGNNSDSYFGAKITLAQPRDVVAVRAFLFNDAGAVGSVAYGVVIDPTSGMLLARSPDFTVTASSLNTLHTFPMATAVNVPAGDVIVGMAVAPAGSAGTFFLMAVQSENPTRPNTFFTGSAVNAAPPSPALTAVGGNIFKFMLEAVTTPPATCPAPGNLAVNAITQTSAVVTFVAPNPGTGYQVFYVPTGTLLLPGSPNVATANSPVTLSGLTPGTGYDVYAVAACGPTDRSAPAGPIFFSTPCTPPIITAFPYVQNFDVIADGQTLPCGIQVADENGDGFTWEPINSVQQGSVRANVTRAASPFAMVYALNPDAVTGGNDWFYLPAMRFQANSTYRLSFYYRRSNNSLAEALEVKYGLAARAAAQTNLLWTNSNINSANYLLADNGSTPAVADITTTATGLNYIGFHCNSQPDKKFLAVDDVTVSVLLATSAALARAVNIYPNPSATGRFTLDISGANAVGALSVDVTNMLGQRVHSSTVRDNFRNELDLSALPAGIYSLRVSNGREQLQQQVVIVK